MAYCINEMSPVATVTSMNEHRKVTVETVNGKWPVAMAIWEMGRAPLVWQEQAYHQAAALFVLIDGEGGDGRVERVRVVILEVIGLRPSKYVLDEATWGSYKARAATMDAWLRKQDLTSWKWCSEVALGESSGLEYYLQLTRHMCVAATVAATGQGTCVWQSNLDSYAVGRKTEDKG